MVEYILIAVLLSSLSCSSSFAALATGRLSHRALGLDVTPGVGCIRAGKRLPQMGRLVAVEKIDPNLQRTYAGEPAGVGAIYSWWGNSKAGAGTMTITDSQPKRVDSDQARISQAFQSDQHRGVRLQDGKSNRGHLEHVGPQELHVQGGWPVHEYG